jgi:hypothetical protein
MKTMNRMLFVAATAVTFTFTNTSLAGDLAASPRVQQMLADRAKPLMGTPVVSLASKEACCESLTLAASPKVQKALAERPQCSAVNSPTMARVDDGIAASPKLREQLNDRPVEFRIAPLK